MKNGGELLSIPYLPGKGAVYPTDSNGGNPCILGLTEDADPREFMIFLATTELHGLFPDVIGDFVAMRRTKELAAEARMWGG